MRELDLDARRFKGLQGRDGLAVFPLQQQLHALAHFHQCLDPQGTSQVGCGLANCPDGGHVVCFYQVRRCGALLPRRLPL